MTSRLTSIMPSMPVSDLAASISFYTEKLGFAVTFRNKDLFVIIRKDEVEIGLAPAAVHQGIPGKSNVYLKVTGIETLYAAIEAAGVTIAHPLRTEPYDMKEFMIVDPDGNTINYGEPC